MTDCARCSPDPSARLVGLYSRVRNELDGLPIINPALEVEAVGFEPWERHWLGIMITPWFMNVVLAPRDARSWQPLPPGDKRVVCLPAGEFEFIGAADADVGEFCIASLFSPMFEFGDQTSARLVATSVRDILVAASPAHAAAASPPSRRLEHALDRQQTRADFVHGRFPQASQ